MTAFKKKDLKNPEKLKDMVLEELCNIAFDDLGNYVDFENDPAGEMIVTIKNSKEVPTRGIAEITQNKSGFKFKLYNKENALVRLGNYLGLWKEKPEGEAEDMEEIKKMVEE